nr:MAG TPA: hypothetical protein [Caudoviricetes sp.]
MVVLCFFYGSKYCAKYIIVFIVVYNRICLC